MGRGRSGRVSTVAVDRTNTSNQSHPSVNDIDAYGVLNQGLRSKQSTNPNATGPSNESVQWFIDNMGMNQNEAYRAADVVLFFSRGGDKFMHNDLTDGHGQVNNDVVDKLLDDPRSPVFGAEHHRGLYFSDDNFGGNARAAVSNILSSGTWRESGTTSFSSSIYTAHNFGKWDSAAYNDGVSITLHHPGGSGMPIKHLSSFPHENEVIHSRKQMKKGMKILRHKWSDDMKRIDIWVSD